MSTKDTKSLVVLVFKSWREMNEPSITAYTPSPAVHLDIRKALSALTQHRHWSALSAAQLSAPQRQAWQHGTIKSLSAPSAHAADAPGCSERSELNCVAIQLNIDVCRH